MEDTDIHEKLYDASGDGDDIRVRELLAAGADPHRHEDRYGNTALLEAAYQHKDSVVSILLQHGADLNIQNKDGDTALHRAASMGKNEEVKALIKLGAELNIQNNDGNTALYLAAFNGYREVITTLIKAGADLNIENHHGTTALHWRACVSAAIALGYPDIVFQFLIKLPNNAKKGELPLQNTRSN